MAYSSAFGTGPDISLLAKLVRVVDRKGKTLAGAENHVAEHIWLKGSRKKMKKDGYEKRPIIYPFSQRNL